MSNSDNKHNGTGTIAQAIDTHREESIFSGRAWLSRVLTIWGSRLFMLTLIAVGIIGLTHFASEVNNPEPMLAPADEAEAGIIDRTKLLKVWLPQTIAELVQRHSRLSETPTGETWQRLLAAHSEANLWFAITVRGYQRGGGEVDLTFVRYPRRVPGHFTELLSVLTTLAGVPPRGPADDLSTPSIHVLPPESRARAPHEVMADLLGYARAARP